MVADVSMEQGSQESCPSLSLELMVSNPRAHASKY